VISHGLITCGQKRGCVYRGDVLKIYIVGHLVPLDVRRPTSGIVTNKEILDDSLAIGGVLIGLGIPDYVVSSANNTGSAKV